MGVTTICYRLSPEALAIVRDEPELIDWLIGSTDDLGGGARLGNVAEARPAWLDLDKAWDDILRALEGAGHEAAYRALDIAADPALHDDQEVRVYEPAAVALGAAALGAVALDRLGAVVAERDLRTYNGEPMAAQIDDVVGNLAELARFWRSAAATGDGIVSCTG